jgi:hypothetical protein
MDRPQALDLLPRLRRQGTGELLDVNAGTEAQIQQDPPSARLKAPQQTKYQCKIDIR